LEAVRKRPGMYIGDTDDGSGLHHMVYEVVDNGIDEALAGHATRDGHAPPRRQRLGLRQRPRHSRGHPREEGVSAAEVIMTQLHAGGKFDQNSYKVSGGLHGVGVSVVNALSDWLELRIWRDGKEHLRPLRAWRYRRSIWKVVGDADGKHRDGGALSRLDRHLLEPRLLLQDAGKPPAGTRLPQFRRAHRAGGRTPRRARRVEMEYEGGVREFVKYLDRSKTPMIEEPIYVEGERDGIGIEVAMWWNDSYHENVLPFTNNIPQRDGGTHLAGFRGALTRTINHYANSSGIAKRRR
jgi:DNA gyrase subunit B